MGSSIPMFRFALFASPFLGFTRAQTAHQSVFTIDAFSFQQSCVQNCFTMGYSGIDCNMDVLGSAIGCPNSPCSKTFAAVDDCYCRGDLQTAAHEWLSICIDELCSVGDNAVNLANAASIYSGYCTERGFTALPAQNTAETTSPSRDSASTANTRPGATSASSTSSPTTSSFSPDSADTPPGATSASSASSPNISSSSPVSTNSTLTIALAVVGGMAAIAILLAAIFFWKIRRKKKQAYSGPVNLGPWPNNPSTQQLRSQGGSRLSDGATEIYPNDSASQVNQPASMGPSYPHYPVPPSAISSNRPGYGQSTIGPGRNYPRY